MQIGGGVVRHWKTRWPEWWVSTTWLGQSILIALGNNLHSNQLYSVLRSMLNMHVIAGTAAGISSLWIVALILNGTFLGFRRISPWIRVTTATCASLYWAVYAVTLFQAADYTSVGWYNNAALSAVAAMCVFMAAGEVAHADKKAEQWHRIRRKIGGL